MKRFLLQVAGMLGIRKMLVEAVINKRSKKLYGSFINKGSLVFDIGANVGNRAALFTSLGANVICAEPQQACVDALKERFKNNTQVTIVAQGVSDEEGTMVLHTSDDSSVIATMSDKWREEGRFSKNTTWNSSQTVKVTTLDQLINLHGVPVFCKIDVEGFEKKVIAGLSKKINVVSFEFTSEFFSDAVDCIEMLNNIGPVALNYSLGESMLLHNAGFINYKECIEQINSITDELKWGDIYVKFID